MKVYKVTLIVSSITFAVLTVAAICFHFLFDGDNAAFLVNWLVGIACSIVVVIMTTFIQFRVEQRKAIAKTEEAVFWLLFTLHYWLETITSDYWEDLNEQERNEKIVACIKDLNESLKAIEIECSNIEFFRKRLKNEMNAIQNRISLLEFLWKKDGQFFAAIVRSRKYAIAIGNSATKFSRKSYFGIKIEKIIKDLGEVSIQ